MLVLKEAFRAIRRTPLTSAMTALTIGAALGLAGLFLHLTMKAREALDDVRKNLVIEAFFDPGVPSDIAEEREEIALQRMGVVRTKEFVSKERAKEEYQRSSGEDIEAVLGSNPLPASIRITLHSSSPRTFAQVERDLRSIEGIREIRSDVQLIRTLEDRSNALDLMALIICSLLGLSALAFIGATTRLAVQSRRETVHVMKMMGASRSTLLGPFILEGAFAGLVGGVLGAVLFLILNTYVLSVVAPEIAYATNMHDSTIAAGLLTVTGIVLGSIVSTLTAVRVVARTK